MLPRFQLPPDLRGSGSCVARRGLLGRRASRSGDTEGARQRLPRTCALEGVLVCCPQAGLPTFPVPPVPGTRGKQICWIQVGGQKRGVQVTLDGSDATGTLLPALPQRFLHMLSAAMTELRELGGAGGDFDQCATRARPRCVGGALETSLGRGVPRSCQTVSARLYRKSVR